MTYDNLGNAKAKVGDFNGAINDFTKAIELDSENAEVYYSRGAAKFLLGDRTGALKDLNKAGELGYAEAYGVIRKIKAGDGL